MSIRACASPKRCCNSGISDRSGKGGRIQRFSRSRFQKAIELRPDCRVYALQGNRAAAFRVLEQLNALAKQRWVSPYRFAILHAALGERDSAIADIERAHAERSRYLTFLGLDPRLDGIRASPRVRKVLDAVGLP